MLAVGTILLWSGSIATIPAGWALCDGSQGTPDLRDRFLLGAGGSFNPGNTGGDSIHNHTFTGDGHTHDISAGFGLEPGIDAADITDVTAGSGTTDNQSSLPSYFALAYIMRI